MNNDFRNDYSDYLMHYGIKGMKWDHHIYKKKEEQPARPGRPGRQTGYQHASNTVQAVQNVSRDGIGSTVLQDAAARIPHFQPVSGPVNISNSKKNPKAKSAVNQRDQENNKRELASGLHQVAKKYNQSKKDQVGHFVNQFLQNYQHQRENPLGNAVNQFMQNSQHHHTIISDTLNDMKRRKKNRR